MYRSIGPSYVARERLNQERPYERRRRWVQNLAGFIHLAELELFRLSQDEKDELVKQSMQDTLGDASRFCEASSDDPAQSHD